MSPLALILPLVCSRGMPLCPRGRTDLTVGHGLGGRPTRAQGHPAATDQGEGSEAGKGSNFLLLALPSLTGGPAQSLAAIQGKKSLVVFFVNEQCGVTFYYKARLQKLMKDFPQFAYVGVRTGRKQFPDRPVELPESDYLKMPFLDDVDNALMKAFKVGQSMTFAVLEGQTLRYQGGLDDAVKETSVKKNPLRDALRAVAAGRPVAVPRAPAMGCAILP